MMGVRYCKRMGCVLWCGYITRTNKRRGFLVVFATRLLSSRIRRAASQRRQRSHRSKRPGSAGGHSVPLRPPKKQEFSGGVIGRDPKQQFSGGLIERNPRLIHGKTVRHRWGDHGRYIKTNAADVYLWWPAASSQCAATVKPVFKTQKKK